MAETLQRRIPLESAVAALVIASGVPMARLVRGPGYGGLLFASLVLSLALSWAFRRLRLPAPLALGLIMLAFVWYAAGVFTPSTLWGPFPTLGSLRALGQIVNAGGISVMEDVAPVALTPGIRLFLSAAVWMTTALIDVALVRARSPLLATAFAIPMFALPGTLVVGDRRVPEMLLFLGAASYVLFLDERLRTLGWGAVVGRARPGWRAVPALRLAALGIVAAIVTMPMLPGYGSEPGLQGVGGNGGRITFNPLVAIKPTLDRSPQRQLFAVRARRAGYYRLTALDTFDGKTWHQRREDRAEQPIGSLPIVPVSPGPVDQVIQDIRIDALAGYWLPAAYEPVSLQGAENVTLESDTRALLSDGLRSGMFYRVVSSVPVVTTAVLDQPFEYGGGSLERYLELPRGVRNDLEPLAERIVEGESTPFRRARALQNYLRTFTYDDRVAEGHSFTTIKQFLLETKRGYCEQFAGTMAVLARALGIPARVVIGFAGGERGQDGVTLVTTEFAHAWVEVYFPSAGWVAFEPTPRAGVARVPAYAQPPAPEDPSAEPTPTSTSATSSPPSQPVPNDPLAGEPDPGGSAGGVTGPVPGWALPLLVVGAIVVVAVGSVIWQAMRLRAAIRHAGSAREVVASRYVDFLAWCAAAGYARRAGETPREHAARIGSAVVPAAHALARLADLTGEALWAPPNGLDPTEAERVAGTARAALAAALPRRARLLATVGWGRWRAAG